MDVMHAWVGCNSCPITSQAHELILSWDSKTPVSCRCGGVVCLCVWGLGGVYERNIENAGQARRFFREVLWREGKRGTVQ